MLARTYELRCPFHFQDPSTSTAAPETTPETAAALEDEDEVFEWPEGYDPEANDPELNKVKNQRPTVRLLQITHRGGGG